MRSGPAPSHRPPPPAFQIGKPVKITLGEYTNLKLTTPEDVVIAKEILRSRK